MSELLDCPEEDVLRELRYCAGQPGARFFKGQIGRAQDVALERGWLERDTLHTSLLRLTDAGRLRLAAAELADAARRR